MNIVKELRIRMGMQQKELALLAGVSRPTVSEWEHNKKDPSGERLRKLSQIFGVDAGTILCYSPPPFQTYPSTEEMRQDIQEKLFPNIPRTAEARTVSAGMDELPPEQRQLIVNMVTAMYPDVFKKTKGMEDDDTKL